MSGQVVEGEAFSDLVEAALARSSCGKLVWSACRLAGVSWLQRMDMKNQLRAERDNERLRETVDEEASTAEIVSSHASFVPGLLGLAAAAVTLVAGVARTYSRR